MIGLKNSLETPRYELNQSWFVVGPIDTNISQTAITIYQFWYKQMHLKMAFARCRALCLGLYVPKSIFLRALLCWQPRNETKSSYPGYICYCVKSGKDLLWTDLLANCPLYVIYQIFIDTFVCIINTSNHFYCKNGWYIVQCFVICNIPSAYSKNGEHKLPMAFNVLGYTVYVSFSFYQLIGA